MTNPFRHKPQNNYYTDFKEIIGMKRNLEQFTGKTLKFVSMTHKIRIIILWTFFLFTISATKPILQVTPQKSSSI